MLLAEMREKLASKATRGSLHAEAVRVRSAAIERTQERMCRRVLFQYNDWLSRCREELSVIWQPLRELLTISLIDKMKSFKNRREFSFLPSVLVSGSWA